MLSITHARSLWHRFPPLRLHAAPAAPMNTLSNGWQVPVVLSVSPAHNRAGSHSAPVPPHFSPTFAGVTHALVFSEQIRPSAHSSFSVQLAPADWRSVHFPG